MIKYIKSLFAWNVIKLQGVWILWENAITGNRDVTRWSKVGHSPYPSYWLFEEKGV